MGHGGPGRPVKAAAVGLLGIFLWGSLAGVEAWPLTGWKLYSRERGPTNSTWRAVTVDGAGREHNIDFKSLPVAYHQGVDNLSGLPAMSPRQRDDVCVAWGEVMHRRGAAVTAVRLYRVVLPIPSTAREAPEPVRRRLVHECTRPR